MDLNNEYLLIPQAVKDSLVDTPERLSLLGSINLEDFQTEFKEALSEGTFNSEQALLLGLQMPSSTLTKVKDVFASYFPARH